VAVLLTSRNSPKAATQLAAMTHTGKKNLSSKSAAAGMRLPRIDQLGRPIRRAERARSRW
jgi:hypothetical protein